MANLLKHLPDEEQLLNRSLDEIGGCILHALVEDRANNLRYCFRPKNELSGCFPLDGGRYRHEAWEQLQLVLMEAFNWLQGEGLVAETPDQMNIGWQFVTRRGLAAASDFRGYRSGKGVSTWCRRWPSALGRYLSEDSSTRRSCRRSKRWK
jgi:hypothetical protein